MRLSYCNEDLPISCCICKSRDLVEISSNKGIDGYTHYILLCRECGEESKTWLTLKLWIKTDAK